MKKKQPNLVEAKAVVVTGDVKSSRQQTLRDAALAILAGSKRDEVLIKYAVDESELTAYLNQLFPTDGERYKFVEDCMLANAARANQVFQSKFADMTPVEAAKAATMFAGKALEIKKAREAGFKEQPVDVRVIVALEKTLSKLVPKTVTANG